jgi:hypothetical protein
VEELGKDVHNRDEPRIEMERGGEGLGLAEMALRDVGGEPGRSVVELLAKPRAAADRLHRADDMEHRVDAAVGLDGEELYNEAVALKDNLEEQRKALANLVAAIAERQVPCGPRGSRTAGSLTLPPGPT